MRRPSRAGLSLVLAFCAGIPLAAQNLESIGREKPFSFSGGLSLNQVFYSSHGIASRRDPYGFVAAGNLNLSLYGWTIPLSFSWSNQHRTFSQPFNQYVIHPSWKWISVHAGYTSLSFSPYTVNGHTFRGAAVELAPAGKWKLSALYGRFLKPVAYDTTRENTTPAYQRDGYGLKAAYDTGRDYLHFILFHAGDDLNSIADIPDSLGISPQENLVLSIGAGKAILKHFLISAEIATTAITRDIRTPEAAHDHPAAKASFLFTPRLSSAYYNALKTALNYRKNDWTLGLAFERIDPGYRTLGAYYFNNDLENTTMNGSGGLFEGKLSFAASAGVQRDNLDKTKVSTMRRMVGSINVNYIPSQKFNLSASYSSFQTHTNIRSQFEEINQLTTFENPDTLNFTQIARNASLSGMFVLSASENKRQHLNLQLSWQDAAETQGQAPQHGDARFRNATASYTIALVPRNIHAALAFNAALNEGAALHTRMMGPTLSIGKSFLQRKLRTTLSSSYNRTYSNGVNTHAVMNHRINSVFSLRGRHNLNVSAVMASRITKSEEAKKTHREFTATVGYSYRFAGRGE